MKKGKGGMEVQREKWRRQESEKKSTKGDGKQKALIWWEKLWKCQYPELNRSRLQSLNRGKVAPSFKATRAQKRAQ